MILDLLEFLGGSRGKNRTPQGGPPRDPPQFQAEYFESKKSFIILSYLTRKSELTGALSLGSISFLKNRVL